MVKENMFNVEKHLNDTLHNPQDRGRSHTEREIVAAAAALGRDTYERPAPPSAEERARQRGAPLGEGGLLLAQRGMVMRVETSALPKPKQKTRKAAEPLDANNRGNMMKRIQADGAWPRCAPRWCPVVHAEGVPTARMWWGGQAGGSGASGHARAAVDYLNKNRRAEPDEDEPLLGGWAGGSGSAAVLPAAGPAELPPAPSRGGQLGPAAPEGPRNDRLHLPAAPAGPPALPPATVRLRGRRAGKEGRCDSSSNSSSGSDGGAGSSRDSGSSSSSSGEHRKRKRRRRKAGEEEREAAKKRRRKQGRDKKGKKGRDERDKKRKRRARRHEGEKHRRSGKRAR
eukprot:jgi/Tetstr1/436772/TSEL_025552.t1